MTIFNRIDCRIRLFEKQFGAPPISLYLGIDEINQLKSELNFLDLEGKPNQYNGINVYPVNRKEHIGLGVY